ncbi:ATP-binding protein [Ureibacillus chungkukjangi]|uniref:histidine kinase n=1 Tax=Ureibacillus chungkukjangi TaxID=1202712 RepID=A0A318TPC4_9BACL|nr:ATP-binding protein [Ureibacillus chungkukjangi]PYF06494.1 two-component system, sporulation sensor kinase E [Ureibacillus chungkukjangi]
MVKTVRPIFRKLFQTVKDPVLILNTSCQIESINDYAAQMLNIDQSSRSLLEMDESSKSKWNNYLKKIQSTLGGFCNLNLKIDEGKYKEFRMMGYFHEKKDLIFVRISPKSEASSINESNSIDIYSMFNDISHGIILTDLNGEIVDLNSQALQCMQCEKSQIIKKQHEVIFETLSDYEYSKLQYFANLMNGGRATINVSSDIGKPSYYKMESKFNYNMNMIVTTITDETEKILLKQQVEQQQTLNSIGQMAASIAHEIRNPMTSLKGFVDLLRLNSNEDHQNYLSVMDSELQRMESILTDLLYLSKPKQRSYEETSITHVVKEVIELMIPHAIQYNVMLKMDDSNYCPISIMGNHNRLKQMLINLVKNAIEVMCSGGVVVIKLENHDGGVEVSVIDEGTGLSDAEMDQLFTPFFTTKATGTGLGLALVKKVIEEHNGTISVESNIGIGTTFKISLPISERQYLRHEDDNLIEMWMSHDSFNRLPVV